MYISVETWILVVCTAVFTLIAAFIDYRSHRIPNKLTVPAFVLGWVFQFYAAGAAGLLDGLLGFAIGFGMYFILWLIGGGGGGDAKLAGAVSVWLGYKQTLFMIIVSTVFVIIGTGFVMLYSMLTRGVYRTKEKMLPSSDSSGKTKKHMELLKFNKGRVGMTFALSVALATICVTSAHALIETSKNSRAAHAKQEIQQESKAPQKQTAPAASPSKTTDKPKTIEKKS